MEKYPYFIYPAVMRLREGTPSADEAARLRRIVAANVGDIPSLRVMLGLDPEEFAEFYPDLLPATLSTADTIDSFLTRFGNPQAPVPQAAAEIPGEAPVPVAEAPVSVVEAIAPGDDIVLPADDATVSAIDAFLASERPAQAPPTEAQARIFIKNHNYQSALEIIQRLSLINPEKSVYFADQIRFLKKLILNEAQKPT